MLIIVVSVVLVLSCVIVHGSIMQNAAKVIFPVNRNVSFSRIGLLIVVAIISHLIQIIMFEFAYAWMVPDPAHGAIAGIETPDWGDLFYFSAVTYTSTGYGDLTPTGNLRFLAMIEALTGLIMVAWTTSFAFLLMQRYWFAQQEREKSDANAA